MFECLSLFLWVFESSPSAEGWILLGLVAAATLLSATWVYSDSLILKKKQRADLAGLVWALSVATFWVLALATYLTQRARIAAGARDRPMAMVSQGSEHARSPWPYGFIYIAAVLVVLALAFLTVNHHSGATDNPGDRIDLLFGASSIALIMISILVGFFGIFGWQSLRERVDELAKERFAESERVWGRTLDGRINSLNSLFYWRLSVARSAEGKSPRLVAEEEYQDPSLLKTAIHHAEKAVAALEEVDSDLVWATKNNLAYMKALRARRDDARQLVASADELWERYQISHIPAFLLTYIRIYLAISDRPELVPSERLEEIRGILHDLVDGKIDGLSEDQKPLVEHYLKQIGQVAERGPADGGVGADSRAPSVAEISPASARVPEETQMPKRSRWWLRLFG